MSRKRTGIAICIFLFVLIFCFSSCSSAMEQVVGRWETQIQDENLGSLAMVYHFTEEGEIFLEQKQGDQISFSIPFGAFSVSGDQITIESEGSKSVYTFQV